MHPLEQKVLTAIRREELFPAGGKIVVGVSAGPDSVCLLHVLSVLRPALAVSLLAVYVDHGLRPEESGDERAYVRKLSAELLTGFEAVEVDVNELAGRKKISIEHAARDLRYEALRRVAGENKAQWIAVGHTADDQAEEILLRLLRGGGRKGLSGMRMWHRGIVRPLLDIEKKDIYSYLEEKKIKFFEDSSNYDNRFLRNRVRHELIPYLEENFEAGIKNALRKSGESLAEDEELLEELTDIAMEQVVSRKTSVGDDDEERIVIDRKSFAQQPQSLQRRIIEKLLWRVGSKASYTHIVKVVEAARSGRTGTELHLSRGLRVGVQRNLLELVYPQGQCSWRGRLYTRR